MKRGLLQLSGIVVDFLALVERLPASGEEVRADTALLTPGGGFNAMAAAKRFGADVAYGGALGVGPFADRARAALASEGIDVLQSRRPPADQGVCVVLAEPNGERSFVLHPGAERMGAIEDLSALPVQDFDWALIGGYAAPEPPAPDPYGAFLSALPASLRLMLDPTPLTIGLDPARLRAALQRADWVSANRREAAAMTGYGDPALSARALARARTGAIVRDGANGCWLAEADGKARKIDGFAVEAVDATGAGDAHIGAFIAARLAGRPPPEAARLANAAAALSVTRLGPATGPTLDETLKFIG